MSYWDRYWRMRASRRGVLRTGAFAGMGAAGLALVGCGDDDDDPSPTSAATSGSGGPTQSAEQPKVGGTAVYPIFGVNSGDPPTLYPYENISYQVQTTASYHYSRLLRGASGPDIGSTDYTAVEGDLAQGLPEQPDDLTYVLKWKPNIVFHDKAPMNGRQATVQDFDQTWQYFAAQAINAARFTNIIEKFEITDDETITITLNEPNAPFVHNGLASDQGVYFIPVETINNDQIRTDPVGTGPWVFDTYEVGVRMAWTRNPNWFEEGQPYWEGINATLVRDPQRIMTALESQEIDYSGALLATQAEEAQQKLDPNGQTRFTFGGGANGTFFNFDNVPWRDKRVRQALSMAMDRDGYLDILDPTGEGTWNSFFGPALEPFFMSPREDAELWGETASFFEHNVTEAKALLAAAGYPNGLDVNIISNVDRYGPASQQQWELVASTIRDAGFNTQNVYQEYGAYIQSTYFGQIQDPIGIGLGPLIGTVLDPDDMLNTCYWSGSARHNWSGTPIDEQATLDEMFQTQKTLLDLEERTEYIQELQREMAKSFLTVTTVATPGFSYTQPWVKDAFFKSTYAYSTDTFRKAYFTDERIARG